MIARSVLEMITSLMPAALAFCSAGIVSGKGCQEPMLAHSSWPWCSFQRW